MLVKRILKFVFPAVFGLIVYAIIRLLQDTESGFRFWDRPLRTNLIEIIVSITVGYINIYIVNRICNVNDSRQTGGKLNLSLLWQEPLIITLTNAMVVNAIITPMAALTDDGLSLSDLVNINIVPLLCLLIYYGVIRSGKFLKAYVQHQLLVEKLTNDHLETELKFLKAQYHPHFLFNALNTIYFQMDEDIMAAKKSTELLSSLLRYQLYDQQQQVTISQELAYLNDYIAFQKIRASKKLGVTVSFDGQLTHQLIYPLLLLPLVENAFKYVGGKYQIMVNAGLLDNSLVFSVANDIPAKMAVKDNYNGIGLENLRRRLQLLYPNHHRLAVNQTDHQFIAELALKF